MEKSLGSKNTKEKLPQKKKPRQGLGGRQAREQVLNGEYKHYAQFLTDQASRRGKDFRERVAATRVKDLLQHQLAMLRLTREMNKLLNHLTTPDKSTNKYFDHQTPTHKSKKKSSIKANEYVIFSGGSRGLEYLSLKKSRTGTFRMEIDVSEYEPQHLQIHTENNKTMHVKACRDSGVRKTLKIVSPAGIDIDDVIIHYPQDGILVLEAP